MLLRRTLTLTLIQRLQAIKRAQKTEQVRELNKVKRARQRAETGGCKVYQMLGQFELS